MREKHVNTAETEILKIKCTFYNETKQMYYGFPPIFKDSPLMK